MSTVLQRLAAGVEPIEVTIPEGLTVREIAALLAAHDLGSAESFRCFAADPDFLLAAGVPGPQLEGYLFPDTYRLPPHLDPSEILAIMVRRFHERFDAAHYRRAAGADSASTGRDAGLDHREEETGKPAEHGKLIAAVFHQSPADRYAAQSDPTVIYAIPDFNGDLTRADPPVAVQHVSANGLPPGPSRQPGARRDRPRWHPPTHGALLRLPGTTAPTSFRRRSPSTTARSRATSNSDIDFAFPSLHNARAMGGAAWYDEPDADRSGRRSWCGYLDAYILKAGRADTRGRSG
jgi:hypothetical protein